MLEQVFNMLNTCPPGCCSTSVQQVFNKNTNHKWVGEGVTCVRGVPRESRFGSRRYVFGPLLQLWVSMDRSQ